MTKLEDYQWLFRKSPVMATSIGEDGTFQDVNDAFLERLGYEREELLGRRPLDFVTLESRRRIEEEFAPALRRTGRLENKPIGIVSRSGEVVNCMTSSLVEYDPEGARILFNLFRCEAHCETMKTSLKLMHERDFGDDEASNKEIDKALSMLDEIL